MKLSRLSLTIDASDAAMAETLLNLCGAISVALADAEDQPLFEPGVGETPLWPRVTICGLFPAGTDRAALHRVLEQQFGPGLEIDIEQVSEADWEAGLHQTVKNRCIGQRLEILPADSRTSTADRIGLRLHMGLAFGTGQHSTTSLCLEWLDAQALDDRSVLDFGCGTGILAIAALLLGAGQAWATDTDPQALAATRANAALNGIESRIRVIPVDRVDTARPDVILANVLAGTLIELRHQFAGLLRTGGQLVLSGILVDQQNAVIEAYERDFEHFETVSRNGWSRIVARRN